MSNQYFNSYFLPQEELTSLKLNSILKILDDQRKYNGPFAVSRLSVTSSAWQPTTSSFYLQLDEDPLYIGGIESNNEVPTSYKFLPGVKETIRRFTVEYVEPTINEFWEWKDLQFFDITIEGQSKWVTKLSDKNLKGNVGINITGGEVNYTLLTGNKMSCRKDWDSLPIWNGNKKAIIFRVDDNISYLYTGYKAVFDKYGFKCSMAVNYGNIDKNQYYITKNQLVEMSDQDYDVTNHTYSHYGIGRVDDPELAVYNPRYLEHNLSGSTFVLLAETIQPDSSLNHGDPISVWNERGPSGNISYFAQSESTRKPIIHTGVFNTMPAVLFTGGYCNIGTSNLFVPETMEKTLFIVCDPHRTAGSITEALFYSSTGNVDVFSIFQQIPTHSEITIHATGSTGGPDYLYYYGINTTGVQIMTFTFSTTGVHFYRNGSWVESSNGFPTLISGSLTLGGVGGADAGFSGYVFDSMLLNRVAYKDEREAIEGAYANKHKISLLLPPSHSCKILPPYKPLFPLRRLMTSVYGNKSFLEEADNFNGSSYTHKNKKLSTFIPAGDGKTSYDELNISAIMIGHKLMALAGGGVSNTKITGEKINPRFSGVSWHHFDRYFVPILTEISSIVTSPAQSTGTTFTLFSNALTVFNDKPPINEYANSISVYYWHQPSQDYITSGHLEAMFSALLVHTGSFWVTTLSDLTAYWQRANPNSTKVDQRSWV